jgi:PAS domain S-box-containing protein
MKSTRDAFIHPLAFKIGAVIVLAEIVISAVTGAFYINNFNTEIDRRIARNILQPAALMNEGLLKLDVVTDEKHMSELVGEELINAFVIGVNGNIFYSLNNVHTGHSVGSVPQIDLKLLSPRLTRPLVRQEAQQDHIVALAPLLGADGHSLRFFVYIEASTAAAAVQKKNNVGLFVLGSLAMVALTSIVILAAFNLTIFKPLQHILSALRQVEAGDLTTQLTTADTRDELGDLARTFNRMAAHLRQTLETVHRERDLIERIAETSPVGITVVNREGQVTFANSQSEKVLGLSKDTITQRTYNAPAWRITDCDGGPFADEELPFRRVMSTRRPVYDVQHAIVWPNGRRVLLSINAAALLDESGEITNVVCTIEDITERKRNIAVNAARLHLLQFAATHSLDELLEETLNEAEKLTDSLIGFYHFVEDDQKFLTLQNWSAKTKAEFCTAEGKGMHYPLAEAGVWVDCVYQGKPVIHNDYASLPHRKGMPQGHAEVIRELVVPVFRGNRIKAILGVGNKSTDYTEKDVEATSLLADFAWEIAERKRAEEKMLRSEQRLRLHAEQSPLGFLEWDDNFRAIEWNAACERIFGYTREEAIGRHAKDLIMPIEVHELVDGIYHSLMSQTGGQHSINENITKDGRTIICEWFNTTLINKDGKAVGVASVCRDITEQKRMEAELARYREHLEEQVKERTSELEIARNKAQQYLDIAGVILVAIDKNRKVTLINQKGCDVLGSTSREIIGKDWFETFVPENSRQDVIQGFRRLMAGELEPVEYFENPVLTQGGQEKLVAWHNVLLKDNKGNISGTLSSGEDITEKKCAEEQIMKLNQDLRNRAAALETANKELEAFAYSVSHDLRAPLRHIDGFIQLLQKKAGTALDEQSRHYMGAISDSANKMGMLIDELLSFSRMGRHSFSFQQVALETVVREVIRELEPDAAGRNIEWRIGAIPTVRGDASMLQMVLVNLISNALKFTRPRQQAQIEIGSVPGQPSEVVIYVRDNGVGFDMAYADKLFGVFQRLHHSDEFEGTGIGLALVRRIIARHGGRTWAEGKDNRGATFYFALPLTYQRGGDESP